jgi:hypothetical protein
VTEVVALIDVIVPAIATFDESDNGNGSIFIRRGQPKCRPRLLVGFGAYFSDIRHLDPEGMTKHIGGKSYVALGLHEIVEKDDLPVARL